MVVVVVVVVGRGVDRVVVVVVVVTATVVVVVGSVVVVVLLVDVVVVTDVVVLELVVGVVVLVVVIARVGCSLPFTTTTPTGALPCGFSVVIPLMASAATAAPISAPTANRPEPPSSVSMWSEYRVHSFGSSRTRE